MIEFLESFGLFTQEELSSAADLLTIRHLQRGEYFITEGTTCEEVAILKSGILRSYYLSHTGEEITYCFLFPPRFVAAYSSFITGDPSPEYIQAISPVEMYVISKQNIELLTEQSLSWLRLRKFLAEQQYVEFEKRIFAYQKEKALDRYKLLLENQPEYLREIPLQYLASYLGITARHLSRIRREIHL